MSILAIISYPDQGSAGEAVAALKRRQKEFLIELEDVAWVTRSQDGRMKLRQGTSLTGAGSASSTFWGFLFGLFFLVANRGMGGMNDLLRAMGETGNVDAAFKQVHGGSYRETLEAWAERLRRQHGS